MKEIFKNGAFLFLRLLVVAVMSLIVTISMSVLSTAVFTKDIGYTAYVTDENGKEIDTYHFNNADGEDKLYNEYTKKGYKVNKMTERSPLEGKGAVFNTLISQGISLLMLLVFIHNKIFPLGNSDGNLVRFNHKSEDKLKGLKIGLVASIPGFIIYLSMFVIFAIGKRVPVSVFTLPHFYLFQIIKPIIGNALNIDELSVIRIILLILPLAVVPIASYVSYLLGYKDILIFEKLTYKKKK